MADDTPTASADASAPAGGFEPITSQEAADAYVAAHLPADYEQALSRTAELESKLADSERARLALQVSASTGVPAESLTGSTREELEASAQALLAWRDATTPKKPAPKLRQPGLRSGSSPQQEPPSPKAAAAAALRRMRGAE
ncbi:hypothetical protein [Actinomyces qiguomingii]|uniref:hypothetical protein n=1 Tax=Actinomyces qiguomingii TaxID=2057800 RepID=UPI000CA0485C|nr:hypothetical protein [Actinomyces qiguomingii]